MNNMTFDECIVIAKMFAYVSGDRSVSFSEIENDTACSLVKRIADQRWDWTEQQRAQFKTLVDLVKSYE